MQEGLVHSMVVVIRLAISFALNIASIGTLVIVAAVLSTHLKEIYHLAILLAHLYRLYSFVNVYVVLHELNEKNVFLSCKD